MSKNVRFILHGSSFLLSVDLAIDLIQAYVDREDAEGEYMMGMFHYYGIEMPQNFNSAFKLFTLSSQKGNAEAEWHLGLMHACGEGVEQDFAKAKELYLSSAEKNSQRRNATLELCTMQGRVVK